MTARTVRIRRADGTLRLVEYSRSGRVKSDQPACENCQGTGVDPITTRLEYLRAQIDAECISYGEIAELQSLAGHIDPSDAQLLEWAGVPEHPRPELRPGQRRFTAYRAAEGLWGVWDALLDEPVNAAFRDTRHAARAAATRLESERTD